MEININSMKCGITRVEEMCSLLQENKKIKDTESFKKIISNLDGLKFDVEEIKAAVDSLKRNFDSVKENFNKNKKDAK